MEKQEYKIEYNGTEVLFSAHNLKTAWDHVEEFIERNKAVNAMKVYKLNENYIGDNQRIGERWRLIEEVAQEVYQEDSSGWENQYDIYINKKGLYIDEYNIDKDGVRVGKIEDYCRGVKKRFFAGWNLSTPGKSRLFEHRQAAIKYAVGK